MIPNRRAVILNAVKNLSKILRVAQDDRSFMKPRGYIALISVIIVSAVAVVLTAGILLRATGESKIITTEDARDRARAAVQACAETALIRLKDSTSYTGNETLSVNGDTCAILSVLGTGGTNRTVRATSTVSGYSQKLRVQVDTVNPTMVVSSWQEVPDF